MKMTTHSFNSFEEIDQRLKILWLQKEIDQENIKLSMHNTKEYFCPTNLLSGLGSSVGFAGLLQNVFVPFVANILITKLFRKKCSD